MKKARKAKEAANFDVTVADLKVQRRRARKAEQKAKKAAERAAREELLEATRTDNIDTNKHQTTIA